MRTESIVGTEGARDKSGSGQHGYCVPSRRHGDGMRNLFGPNASGKRMLVRQGGVILGYWDIRRWTME